MAETNLPAEEQDLPKRVDGFNKEMQSLLGKYELALGATPMFFPDGRVGAQPMLSSARKKPEIKTV